MPAKVRGRAACNQCRSRKQKCDEKRPVCSRCRDLDKPCQWPGLRKRGPPKGYTEALEHRLRETERALLRVISVVDGATLTSAFEGSTRGEIPDAPSDSKADKADMAAYWEQFPLSTPRDMMNWASEQQTGAAALATMQISAKPAARLGRQLPTKNAEMSFAAPFTDNGVEFSRNTANISTSPSFLPGGSPDSNTQGNTFDMPEQFKEQYIW